MLEPIDMAEHLDKIELYLGQVCAIAGISKMQLDYWTNKAQIPTKGKKQRIYDMDAVETVMLIKQAKDKGLNLGAAIDAAAASATSRPPPRTSGDSQLRCGLLRRDRVDVDPCAELEAGEPRRAREELEVPVRAVVQPRVQRHERLAAHALQPPHELGEQAAAQGRAGRCAGPSGSRPRGCDQHLVGNAARDRAAGDETVALEHGRRPPAARARR